MNTLPNPSYGCHAPQSLLWMNTLRFACPYWWRGNLVYHSTRSATRCRCSTASPNMLQTNNKNLSDILLTFLLLPTQTDVTKGARADPSALVAAQLGLQLHALGDSLPLFDGVTGRRVAPETDKVIDAVRDALMDDAAQHAEDMGDDAAKGASWSRKAIRVADL